MFIEALVKPLRVTLPGNDGDVMLYPSVPVDLPPRLASKLIQQAKGRVRLSISPTASWLTLWRVVAELSMGLEDTNPRLPIVLAAIQGCDAPFRLGNKLAFLLAAEGVAKAMAMDKNDNSRPF